MRLGRLGESGVIGRIKALTRRPGRSVLIGIGDDAAAYRPPVGTALVTTDMMVEGVHFDSCYTPWRKLGWKALATNMSDIAAMGGAPIYYLVSLALTPDTRSGAVEELYRGMEEAACPHGVRLIGGDTCSSPGPAVVSVTLIGEAGPEGPVSRSGARPGDDIYVTGTLGDSAAGLELLKTGDVCRAQGTCGGDAGYLISRHTMPDARVKAGVSLSGKASAMIDVSDGFSTDLRHILDESGVGAEVTPELIPLSAALLSYAGPKRALAFALHGGEDYELIFTARPSRRKSISALMAGSGVAACRVGVITEKKTACLVSGKGSVKELRPRGYEHFRK